MQYASLIHTRPLASALAEMHDQLQALKARLTLVRRLGGSEIQYLAPARNGLSFLDHLSLSIDIGSVQLL
jgi:hypothetical protein